MTQARETASSYIGANPFERAASLSYYTLLSFAPLIVVLLAIGSYAFGERAIRGELLRQISALIGPDAADLLESIARDARQSGHGVTSTLVGGVLTLFGATTVFAELQAALNRIWRVESEPRSALSGIVKVRLQSFAMMLGTAFLLLVSLVLTASLGALQGALPTAGILWGAVDFVVSIIFLTVVFAALYKYVPDVEIRWRDTWIGAALTAVLFSVGKIGIGLYVARASVGSPYGAAGSIVVLMVWVYYAALVFFFGAVATKMLAARRGSPIRPSEHAHLIKEPCSSADAGRRR